MEENFIQFLNSDLVSTKDLRVFGDWLLEKKDIRGEMLNCIGFILDNESDARRDSMRNRLRHLDLELVEQYELDKMAHKELNIEWKYGFIIKLNIYSDEALALISKFVVPETCKFLSDISIMNCSHIPEWLINLPHLKRLKWSSDTLDDLPSELQKLTQISELELENNRITHMPPCIDLCENLEYIGLSNNRLTEFPGELCNLKGLKRINLHGNQIAEIPQSIKSLGRLSVINLALNNLDSIPQVFCEMPNLDNVILHNNNIQDPPAALGDLTTLRLDEVLPIYFRQPEIDWDDKNPVKNLDLIFNYNGREVLPVEYEYDYFGYKFSIDDKYALTIELNDQELFEFESIDMYDPYRDRWPDEKTTVYLYMLTEAILKNKLNELKLPETREALLQHPAYTEGPLPKYSLLLTRESEFERSCLGDIRVPASSPFIRWRDYQYI